MKRAEQHVIERTHPQFRAIDGTGSGVEEPLEPGQLLCPAVVSFSAEIPQQHSNFPCRQTDGGLHSASR